MTVARWRRRRLAPIPTTRPTVAVYPPPVTHTAGGDCPDCTPTVPCVLCRALGDRTRGEAS